MAWQLLKALKDEADQLKVIMLTAQGSVETAVEALKDGAEDYLTKPVDPQKLRLLLQRIAELNAQKRENEALRRQLREKGSFGRIVGHSPKMRKIYQVIEQAAPTPASVLIIGESGTGKELVAQTIHQLSPRAEAPFVAINCAAIPETLLESEIFGHERGAFTGAIDRRAGCFELADRGTLFLDEIAEMVPVTQVKLLRVLQERRFRRLGGRVEQEVDVRVIAATNMDPLDAIRDGKLRDDLYYRLNVFTIELPPLRERKEDLPLIIQALLEEFNARDRRNVKAVDAGSDAHAGAVRLARQRARAAQRHRARDDSRARRVHRAAALAALRPPAAARRAAGERRDDRAGHDRRRSRTQTDPRHARGRRQQQDPRRRDARHQPEDAAQQAESDEADDIGGVRMRVRSPKCGVRVRVRSAEVRVRSAECGVRSAKCGVRGRGVARSDLTSTSDFALGLALGTSTSDSALGLRTSHSHGT